MHYLYDHIIPDPVQLEETKKRVVKQISTIIFFVFKDTCKKQPPHKKRYKSKKIYLDYIDFIPQDFKSNLTNDISFLYPMNDFYDGFIECCLLDDTFSYLITLFEESNFLSYTINFKKRKLVLKAAWA